MSTEPTTTTPEEETPPVLASCPACGAAVRLDAAGRPACASGHRIFGRVTPPRPAILAQPAPPGAAELEPAPPGPALEAPEPQDGSQDPQLPAPWPTMGAKAGEAAPGEVEILAEPDFREWLKIARDAARLTQKELSEKVGVHPMTLSKVERGIYRCPLTLQLALRYLLESRK